MKLKALLKKLSGAGFTFKEGKKHTKAYDSDGVFRAAIPKHAEIKELTVMDIAEQTGVKLP